VFILQTRCAGEGTPLSIDLVSNYSALRSDPPASGAPIPGSGPLRHTVVLFGGWGGEWAGGDPLPQQSASGTGRVAERVRQVGRNQRMLGADLLVRAYHGSLVFTSGATSADRDIASRFDPRAQLIVYGYSAGVSEALSLAWSLWQNRTFYDTGTGRFRGSFSGGPSATAGYVRIDRLITVDGAAGHFSSQMFRRIPPNVRRNLNLYQLHPSPIGSHGGPNEAHNRRATDVVNRDLSSLYTRNPGDAHSSIDEDTTLEVLETICSAIGCQALPRVLPQGLAVG
jgi:hypothetical protein